MTCICGLSIAEMIIDEAYFPIDKEMIWKMRLQKSLTDYDYRGLSGKRIFLMTQETSRERRDSSTAAS